MIKESGKCVLSLFSSIAIATYFSNTEKKKSRIKTMNSAFYPKETGNGIAEDPSCPPLLEFLTKAFVAVHT